MDSRRSVSCQLGRCSHLLYQMQAEYISAGTYNRNLGALRLLEVTVNDLHVSVFRQTPTHIAIHVSHLDPALLPAR